MELKDLQSILLPGIPEKRLQIFEFHMFEFLIIVR